VLFRSYHEPIQ